MSKAVFTMQMSMGLVEISIHETGHTFYFDTVKYAYNYMTGAGYFNGKYVMYIDTLDGLEQIEDDGGWAVALLKYADYGTTN